MNLNMITPDKTDEDLKLKLIKLANIAYEGGYDEKELIDDILGRDEAVLFPKYINGELVGVIGTSKFNIIGKSGLYITHLIVHPDYKRQGIATELFLTATTQSPYAYICCVIVNPNIIRMLHKLNKAGYTTYPQLSDLNQINYSMPRSDKTFQLAQQIYQITHPQEVQTLSEGFIMKKADPTYQPNDNPQVWESL